MTDTARIEEIETRLRGISAPEWEVSPNLHGDPFVSEKGRGAFRRIATLSSDPADYGRGNMEFIAHSPADIRFLLAELKDMQVTIAELIQQKEDGTK